MWLKKNRTTAISKILVLKGSESLTHLIILIDAIQDATKQVIKIIKKFDRHKYVFIAGGLINNKKLEYHKILNIKSLSKEEIENFVKNFLFKEFQNCQKDIYKLIVLNSGNTPETIKK